MKHLFTALLTFSAFTNFLHAESMEEVLVTSSFLESSDINNPLYVIDGDDINDGATTSLGEAVDSYLGVSIADYGSAVGQPIIRGMSGPRVKILKNGMVNRDVSSLGADHLNDLDLNNIQQIEIVRGPSSLLYANGTIGVSVDPVLVVHNPYDTAIEFEGIAMVSNGDALPYIFDVSVSSWAFTSTTWQYYDPSRGPPKSTNNEPKPKTDPLWAGVQVVSPITLGEVALGDGAYDNRSFSFRAVAGAGKKFRLEPGEVKVLSPKNLGGTYKSTRASNTTIVTDDFGYDLGNTAVYKMTPFANVRSWCRR